MENWLERITLRVREVLSYLAPRTLIPVGVGNDASPLFFADKDDKDPEPKKGGSSGKDEEDEEDEDGDDEDPEEDDDDSEDEDEDEDEEDEDGDKDDKDDSDDIAGLSKEELLKLYKGTKIQLKKVNNESAGRRKKLAQFEQDIKEEKRKKMTKVQKLQAEKKDTQKEIDELKAQVRSHKVDRKVGQTIITTEDVEYILIDSTDFSMPADKKVKEIPDLLTTLYENKPHLFKKVDEVELNRDGTPKNKNKKGDRGKRKPDIKFTKRL